MASIGELPKKFVDMTKEEFLAWIEELREGLVSCEEAEGFLLGLAEDLNVDMRA